MSTWLRRWWVWALAAGIAVCVAGASVLVWGGDGDGGTAAGPGTTERPTTTSTSTSTSTSTTSTTVRSTTTTTRPAPTTTAPRVTPPGSVTVVSASSGGGSGEVVVNWDAVAGATGYRVLRSGAAEGPYGVAADVDVVTGDVTADPDVASIWSDQHSYLHPGAPPLASPDTSPWFQLVNLGDGQRCFQVIAYNAGGESPPSAVVCGWPP